MAAHASMSLPELPDDLAPAVVGPIYWHALQKLARHTPSDRRVDFYRALFNLGRAFPCYRCRTHFVVNARALRRAAMMASASAPAARVDDAFVRETLRTAGMSIEETIDDIVRADRANPYVNQSLEQQTDDDAAHECESFAHSMSHIDPVVAAYALHARVTRMLAGKGNELLVADTDLQTPYAAFARAAIRDDEHLARFLEAAVTTSRAAIAARDEQVNGADDARRLRMYLQRALEWIARIDGELTLDEADDDRRELSFDALEVVPPERMSASIAEFLALHRRGSSDMHSLATR